MLVVRVVVGSTGGQVASVPALKSGTRMETSNDRRRHRSRKSALRRSYISSKAARWALTKVRIVGRLADDLGSEVAGVADAKVAVDAKDAEEGKVDVVVDGGRGTSVGSWVGEPIEMTGPVDLGTLVASAGT
jgi:hypothetical protein